MKTLTIPGIFPTEYLLILEERNIHLTDVLKELKLTTSLEMLRQQDISFDVMAKLMQAIWERSQNDTTIGIEAGLRISLSAFGTYGQAVLSSEDLTTALNFILDFWPLIGRGIDIQRLNTDEHVILRFQHSTQCEQYLKDWMTESAIFSFWRALISIFPEEKQNITVCLNTADKKFTDCAIPTRFQFNAGTNSIKFPKRLLNFKIPFKSQSSFQAAKAQCINQLKRVQNQNTMTAKVLNILGYQQYGYPTLKNAAVLLSTSQRTLRRHLDEEGTKYSCLLQQVKISDACHILTTTSMRVEKIAELLGYQEEANFCRAFKKWTKVTPSYYRKNNST